MKKKWGSTPQYEARLEDMRRKYKFKCKHCGWFTVIYPFEKKDKKVCRNCGHYVYSDYKYEFIDKVKEVMK